jgi:ribosome-associated heat shock protein Hsp15
LRSADGTPERGDRRLDQWLWFARLAKSRSLAARLCNAGVVVVNGAAARKASQAIRIGDAVSVPQGPWRRTLRVLALGTRRGPAADARKLYEETAQPEVMPDPAAGWTPLLTDDADAGPGEDAAD